ncbi:MAG: UDP-N-acetylmuramoyl-L-alanine--D-glutamate ligase [Micavibrio aeruginosavorus]|uniref:UDP-N-acetylmuramoylalanine--D-glutamate ligase n=1 Tax=Micavibrio aeruginosavorus TaxID=349221 RepID=A0A2W5PZE4_9BACT|nr:MAG: UDP-N-acetylmuramoyl-L-alanine--D-glutamate ligase [Micavibrio aeruginosavorus]
MIDTQPYVRTLQGKPVAVLGLGVSGLATAKALIKGGAQVLVWDDKDDAREKALDEGFNLLNFAVEGLEGYGALVMAPGIPLTHPAPHPAAVRAKEANVEIIGDLEILHRSGHTCKVVGITGTNGKSTTTALVTHILNESGKHAIAAGNIGTPVLMLDLPPRETVLVLEISSYQMDLCPSFRPDIAVLLNISPDHLDRHGGMDGYALSKERMMEGGGTAICAVDDAPTLAIYDRISKTDTRHVIPVSFKKELTGGVYIKDGQLMDAIDGEAVAIGNATDLPALPGTHNGQNLCASYAVCKTLGVAPEDILKYARTYAGLPHRQHTARIINGIAYVNDSKGTNADATVRALSCYSNVYLIAGGRAKEGGLNGIEIYADRLRHVFLIGEAAEDFAVWLKKLGIPHDISGTLDVAVLSAHKMAQDNRGQPGGASTVLLSPACASWDQFRNFEHRGEVFTNLVNALSEDVPS